MFNPLKRWISAKKTMVSLTSKTILKDQIWQRADVQVATRVGDPKCTEGSNLTDRRVLKIFWPGIL